VRELVADSVPGGIQYITLLTFSWIAIFNRLIPMADPESSNSPYAKLLLECSQGFQARDLDVIAKYIHKDFRSVTYPRSLGKKEESKEEFLERWTGIIGLWTGDLDVSYIGCS
jgi:hypothetical protein